MKSFAIAVAAFAVSAAASVGNAIVKNQCSYAIPVRYTPSANPGYTEIDSTLEPNGTPFSAPWEALPNGAGWSIKLTDPTNTANILQYEYTFQDDTLQCIWYDISEVNGLGAFNGDWSIEGDWPGCDPSYKAYLSPDDNPAMQDNCTTNSTVTLTLCASEESSGSSSSSSISLSSYLSTSSASSASSTQSLSAYTSVAASTTSDATTTSSSTFESSATTSATSSATNGHHSHPWTGAVDKAVVAAATTLATSVVTTASAGDDLIVTVTEIDTVIATATVLAQKRAEHVHEHVARHPHGRH